MTAVLINIQELDDAVLAYLLAGTDKPGRLHTAPQPVPDLYWVLQRPPGTQRTGTMGLPEQGLDYRCRILAVAKSSDIEQAGRAATALATELAGVLLDRAVPLAGDGWSVEGRTQLADGGLDPEGRVANATADFTLMVSPASSAP